jgi:hypothetical protein
MSAQTIDVTPSWCTAMDILILMMESGDADGVRQWTSSFS